MNATDDDQLELLGRPVSRRGALALLGGLGLAVAGCSGGNDSNSATATTKGSSATTSTSGATTTTGAATVVTDCSLIPEETGGPFPGDGSNGPDVLSENGVVRQDIRSSFDGLSGTAEGVPVHDAVHRRRRRQRLRADDGSRGVRVALRPRGPLLDVRGRQRPELPPRRAGGRRQRRGPVHQHLPRLLLGSVAPRALRGLSERRRGDERQQQAGDVAARVPRGRVRHGVRHEWVRGECQHLLACRSTPTWCSPTASRPRRRR